MKNKKIIENKEILEKIKEHEKELKDLKKVLRRVVRK